jgi:hypothetical protein
VFLKGVKGTRNADGSFSVQPGGRLIFAAQAPPTACDWTLAFKSEGRIRLRAIQVGSAETIQLSDNVLWDDVDAKPPEGYAPRAAGLAQWVKRFNTDLRWPLAHVTASGLFFFEVSPAGDAAIRFGEPVFRGRALLAPPPLERVSVRRGLDGMPLVLSSAAPSAEIAVDSLAGAVEVEHFAGPQRAASSEILAGWLFVYDDGTTSPAFYSCYKLSGQRLWMLHTGANMFNSAHTTPFICWDMDGDGYGEFLVKTAPGAIDGTGKNILLAGDNATDNMSTTACYFNYQDFTLPASAQWGFGLQLPLDFIGVEDSEAWVIVKSQYGFTSEISYVQPFLYHIRYFHSQI